MTAAPVCLLCRDGHRDFPCRTNGRFDLSRLAETYFVEELQATDDDFDADNWTLSCVFDICRMDLSLAWTLLIDHLLPKVRTRRDLDALSWGVFDEILLQHGPAVIERVEAEAKVNPRFASLCAIHDREERIGTLWDRVTEAGRGASDIACL